MFAITKLFNLLSFSFFHENGAFLPFLARSTITDNNNFGSFSVLSYESNKDAREAYF